MSSPRDGNKKILFIVNPVSGSGKQRDIEQYLKKYLDVSVYSYKVVFTEYRGHAEVLAKQAVADGVEVIVAVGGDGTVNETGRGVVGTETKLAVIPTGSGNGLARHLNLPMNFRKAIDVINRGKSKRIDTATLNDKLFLSMAGVGFDAHVARKFDKTKKRGFISYFNIATSSYRRYKSKKYNISIDGKKIQRKALLISFANSSQFGNNASIDPGAEIDDGLIDVCIVGKIPFWKVTLVSPLFFMKKFDKTPYVEIIKAKEVIVERKKGKYIHLDGDPEKEGKTFTIQVHPLSLHVIIP